MLIGRELLLLLLLLGLRSLLLDNHELRLRWQLYHLLLRLAAWLCHYRWVASTKLSLHVEIDVLKHYEYYQNLSDPWRLKGEKDYTF